MGNLKFRNLYASEIRVRIDQVSKKGATFLLYKDARCDMDILDETVGAENWQRKHEEHKGNLFCSVGINVNYKNPDIDPYWVWKQDCGAESYAEKEKGEASDSFKRACVNWGIGKELYTKIRIFIPLKTEENGTKNGRAVYKLSDPYVSFVVSKIECVGKKIVYLEICDKEGICAFRWEDKTQPRQKTVDDAIDMINEKLPPLHCDRCGKEISEAKQCRKNKKDGKIYCLDCVKELTDEDTR